jgi:uncharacterized protein YggU (UPF0235/DUF167 family)
MLHFPPFYQVLLCDKSVTIALCVHPGAKRTLVRGAKADGAIKMDIAVPAAAGEANAAVVALVAENLGVPPSSVMILCGHHSRRKTLRITL